MRIHDHRFIYTGSEMSKSCKKHLNGQWSICLADKFANDGVFIKQFLSSLLKASFPIDKNYNESVSFCYK